MTRENEDKSKKITLEDARAELNRPRETHFRASDFISEDDRLTIKENNFKKKPVSSFSKVDAYLAEILARFGYETFRAWKAGDISEADMARYVEAERARDARDRLAIEAVVITSLAGAQQPRKKGSKPPIKAAMDIFKNEQKTARGVK